MRKYDSFLVPKETSELFVGFVFIWFTLLIVLPIAVFVASIASKGLLSWLNVPPLLASICSYIFFVVLDKKYENIIVQLFILVVLNIIFVLCITIWGFQSLNC